MSSPEILYFRVNWLHEDRPQAKTDVSAAFQSFYPNNVLSVVTSLNGEEAIVKAAVSAGAYEKSEWYNSQLIYNVYSKDPDSPYTSHSVLRHLLSTSNWNSGDDE